MTRHVPTGAAAGECRPNVNAMNLLSNANGHGQRRTALKAIRLHQRQMATAFFFLLRATVTGRRSSLVPTAVAIGVLRLIGAVLISRTAFTSLVVNMKYTSTIVTTVVVFVLFQNKSVSAFNLFDSFDLFIGLIYHRFL